MQYLGCTMMWSILLCISSGSWRGDKISRFLSALVWMRPWGKMVAWIMILKQKSHRRKCGRNSYLSMGVAAAVDPYLLGWACLPPRLILRRQAGGLVGDAWRYQSQTWGTVMWAPPTRRFFKHHDKCYGELRNLNDDTDGCNILHHWIFSLVEMFLHKSWDKPAIKAIKWCRIFHHQQ